MNSMISALVRTGVAIRTRTLVTSTVQTRIGIRNSVMPGARILKIVTRKLIAPRMELVPISVRPMIQRSVPVPAIRAARERRVLGPAGGGGAARDEEARGHQHAAQRQQPEGQGVDPREGHVRGADLERHDVVAEARQDRDHEQEQHERGVHRERLVVERLVHELQPGDGELRADDEGEDAAGEEEDDRVDQVQDPDLLVVGGREPLVEAAAYGGSGGVEGRGGHPSVLPYWTVSVPVMFGWTVQTKG